MKRKWLFHSPSKTLAVFLAVFCVGMSLLSLRPHTQPSIAHPPSSTIRVSGVVRAEVERRIDTQRVVLDDVTFVDEAQEGKMLTWLPLYPTVAYGDRLTFSCRVQAPEPFDGFAYDKYLATKGIYAICHQPQFIDVLPAESRSLTGGILRVKSALTRSIRRAIPEPHSSFLSGLIFGGSTALSRELKQEFQETGTSHILAASGYNVSLFSVVLLSIMLSFPIKRSRALWIILGALGVYVILAGASAAVVRAGIMGAIVVIEKGVQRKASMRNVLLLTAALMLAISPGLLFYDVGFQLSFVATLGLIGLTRPISGRLLFVPEQWGIRESFASSLAAIMSTLPVILWHFGTVSLVAPIANLLVLPLVPYAMFFTGVSMVMGMIWTPLGILLGIPAWGFSHVALRIIQALGSLPFALATIEHARVFAIALAGIYGLIWLKHTYAPSRT